MGNTAIGAAIERTKQATGELIAEAVRNGVKSTPPAGYAKGGIISDMELKAQMEAVQGFGVMLEEWPSASWGGDESGVSVPTVESQKTEGQKDAEIKALRIRCKDKAEKNNFLSMENAELKKHIKEIKLQKTRLMDDVGDYTKENRRLVDEVNKGNEYRAKIKETVESLHAQIRTAKENEKAATSAAVQTEIELERYKRITDALLDKGPF